MSCVVGAGLHLLFHERSNCLLGVPSSHIDKPPKLITNHRAKFSHADFSIHLKTRPAPRCRRLGGALLWHV